MNNLPISNAPQSPVFPRLGFEPLEYAYNKTFCCGVLWRLFWRVPGIEYLDISIHIDLQKVSSRHGPALITT